MRPSRWLTPLACLIALANTAHAATTAQLDQALNTCSTYKTGQTRAPLTTAETLIRTLRQQPDARKQIEAKLVAMLGSAATTDCKRFVCRQLSILGSATAVPSLAKLLTDPDLAHMARYALERIPDKAATAALRHALPRVQGTLRVGIINSIARRRDTKAVPALAALLKKDPTTAAAAASALGRIGGQQALDVLQATTNSADAGVAQSVRDAILLCADGLLARGKRDAAIAVYNKVYASPTEKPHRRIAAFRGLIAAEGQGAWRRIVDALSAKDEAMWPHAAAFAADIPGSGATTALATHLPKLSPRAQALLLGALAVRGDAAALPGVLAAAKGQDQAVRIAALDALGALGDASCVPTLAALAATGKREEKTTARQSLRRLRRSDVDAAIVTAMKGAEPALRVELIRALAARRATAATPALLKAAGDSDKKVRKDAIKALGLVATEANINDLVGLLCAAKSSSDRRGLQKALSRIAARATNKQEAARVLSTGLARADTKAACAIMPALGNVHCDTARAALVARLHGTAPPQSKAAIKAFEGWPTPEPAPELLSFARKTTDATCQILALRGFARMMAMPSQRPPEQTLTMLTTAMAVAKRPEEKRLVLGALGKVHHVAALDAALPHLADPAVEAEAASALIEIATAVRQTHRTQAIAAVQKILATSKTPAVRQAAENALIAVGQATNIAPQGVASSPDGLEKDGGAGGDQAGIDGNPKTYWDEADSKKLYRFVVTFKQPERLTAISILGYQHHSYAPKDFDVLGDGKVVKTVRNAQYRDNLLVVPLGKLTCKVVELKITGYYGRSPAIRELGIYAPGGKLPAAKP